jgi:signal peptidase I
LAVILGVTAIAVWAVATDRIGYVVTHGVSMNPVYYQGDLVFVVKADSYHVGEIAAYHSTTTGETLHRIIGGDGTTGYTFKGDNNTSTDTDHPTADKLIGHAVLHVPKGGVWLKPLLSPTGLGMMGFLIVSGGAAVPRNRREIPRGRRKKRVKAMQRQGGTAAGAMAVLTAVRRLPPLQQAAAGLVSLFAVLAIVLGVLGWMKPVLQAADTGPTRSMVFSYSATVPRSAAYDGTVVSSPDPIFRKLAHRVDLRMNYQGDPGTFSATVALSSGSGWHSTKQLVSPTKFTGTRYVSTVTLDMDSIDERSQAAAKVIGVEPGPVSINVSARVDGAKSFSAPLQLTLTPIQLGVYGGQGSLTVTDAHDAGPAMEVRKIGFVTASAARSWAVFLLIIAAAGAAALVLLTRRSGSARTRAEIERRFPQLLVHVEPMPSPPGKPVVNVDNFPALVKLAEKYGQMILTWRRPDADDFVVRDEGITYRYRVALDEPTLQNVEMINRPNGAGSHRRKASSSSQVS